MDLNKTLGQIDLTDIKTFHPIAEEYTNMQKLNNKVLNNQQSKKKSKGKSINRELITQKNTYLEKMKCKYNISKPMGHCNSSSDRKV